MSGRNGKKNVIFVLFIMKKNRFSMFSSRYDRKRIFKAEAHRFVLGGASSSKAAFSMFQQKDIAAGGTGKVSRY